MHRKKSERPQDVSEPAKKKQEKASPPADKNAEAVSTPAQTPENASGIAQQTKLSENLKAQQGQPPHVTSGAWLTSLLVATFVLFWSGDVLHHHSSELRPAFSRKDAEEEAAKVSSLLDPVQFLRCNTHMPPSQLRDAQSDLTLAGPLCGADEADAIQGALRAEGYTYDAILPVPHIFPGYLQQALQQLSAEQLVPAMMHLQTNAPKGKLGTLVRAFGWGLPVHKAHLKAALGPEGISALGRCGLLAACTRAPNMTTIMATIFPVPEVHLTTKGDAFVGEGAMPKEVELVAGTSKRSVFVITDWASKSTVGMKESVVPIVNPEGLALVFNSPPSADLHVLDLDTGPGLHGLVAASRGADTTTILVTDARAERFVRFSVWLNGHPGGKVEVVSASSAAKAVDDGVLAEGSFGLVLAQPLFMPTPNPIPGSHRMNGGKDGQERLTEVLKVADKLLSARGLLALEADFGVPQLLPALCAGQGNEIPGLVGTLVLRSEPYPVDGFVAAHPHIATKEEMLSNLMLNGVKAISNGMLFAQKVDKNKVTGGCGSVSMQTLEDPLTWPHQGQTKFDRPCFLSSQTECPEGDANDAPEQLRNSIAATMP